MCITVKLVPTVFIFKQPQPNKLGQVLKWYQVLLDKIILLFISDS